ncbi:MAG: hypothetical protein SPL15_08580 [Lachnospiraceae bacterium]|nr:hypothetical protein [Lachnospiraceae bacterium]MDY5743025.1 hypothetical protein [Lachnospiraceae bacterium]
MKKMQTWKRVLILMVILLTGIRVGYIMIRGETDREYAASARYDLTGAKFIDCTQAELTFISEYRYLNQLEVYLGGVDSKQSGHINVQLFSEDELLYQSKISLKNITNEAWKAIPVNAPLAEGQSYRLNFSASQDCKVIPRLAIVQNDSHATEIQSSQQDGRKIKGQLAVNFGYLRTPGRISRAVMSLLWILFGVGVVFVLLHFERLMAWIKNIVLFAEDQVGSELLWPIVEVFTCAVIIHGSGIEFQPATKIILYAISLIVGFRARFKRNYILEITDCKWKRMMLVLLYIYTAFALVGQRIWIYPLTLKLTGAGIFVFTCAICWSVLLVHSCLYGLNQLRKRSVTTEKRMSALKLGLLCLVMLLLPSLLHLYANNPGIASNDTVACMIDLSENLHGAEDWHPAFYVMFLRAIQKIWNSTYAVILVQYAFWAYVCMEVLLYLRKKGMKDKAILLLAGLLGCNAANIIHLNTIWKDIPYTLSVVWTLVILAKLSIDGEKYRKKRFVYAELVLALIGVVMFRKNGIVTFIIILAGVTVLLYKNRRIWVAVTSCLVVLALIKGPLYSHYRIRPVKSGQFIGLTQDILGAYYAGGEVSENTLKMINVTTSNNNAEYRYTPTWSYSSYDLEINSMEFIKNYLDTFVKNPVTMTRAVIAREDAVWNIFGGQDAVLKYVDYHETMDRNPRWRKKYPARRFVSLYPTVTAATKFTASTQWIAAIEWRSGLMTLLGAISAAFMFFKQQKKRYLLLLAPAVGHFIGLLLSTGWSDFRYFWPLNLLNLILVYLVLIVTQAEKGKQEL